MHYMLPSIALSTSWLAEPIALEDMDADSDPLGSGSPLLRLKYWRIDILNVGKKGQQQAKKAI